MISFTEQNYLKAIYMLTASDKSTVTEVGTNSLALSLDVKPATVNDMLKRLKAKELINYQRYGKISLTDKGKFKALQIVRKHRLWETFLFQKLQFTWDEVHEVAEQLEHIDSEQLINRLDAFLDYPEVDPHGDPIPNARGEMPQKRQFTLSLGEVGKKYIINSVGDSSSSLLQYLEQHNVSVGSLIELIDRVEFDQSLLIIVGESSNKINISKKIAEHLWVIDL